MDIIEKFLNGFRQFQRHCFKDSVAPLIHGQSPTTLIIGCCDSRVDPAMLFGCDPGELFVVRNVANLVPPCEENEGYHGVSSALEFAVMTLKVRHIIVLGHAKCGGIGALMGGAHGTGQGGFIEKWMRIADDARERAMKEPDDGRESRLRTCERAGILVSIKNLMSFPWIKSRVEDGSLHLHGWYFDLDSGSLLRYSATEGEFKVIV